MGTEVGSQYSFASMHCGVRARVMSGWLGSGLRLGLRIKVRVFNDEWPLGEGIDQG